MDEITLLREARPVTLFEVPTTRDAARKRLAVAIAAERNSGRPGQRRVLPRPRRRGLALAIGAAAIFLIVAVPAFGLQQNVINFFSAPAASAPTQESFSSLDVGAPAGMAPGVSGRARSVMDENIAGQDVNLWVAPTAGGGFCFALDTYGLGCDRDRTLQINPTLAAHTLAGPAVVFGDVLSPQADHLKLTYANGDSVSIPLVLVSDPIKAGFFTYQIPSSELDGADWPASLGVVGSDGMTLATSTLNGLPFTSNK